MSTSSSRFRPRAPILYLLCVLTTALGILRAEKADTVPTATVALPKAPRFLQPASTRKMVERLAAIPREVDPFLIPYFAGKTADLVRKRFPEAKTASERATMQWRYATALLNDGRSEEAIEAVNELGRMLAQNGLSPKPEDAGKIKLLQAISWLRLGEQQNCIANHNADS